MDVECAEQPADVGGRLPPLLHGGRGDTRDPLAIRIDRGQIPHHEHLLVANSSHGLIRISHDDVNAQEPLTEPRQPLGVPRKKVSMMPARAKWQPT